MLIDDNDPKKLPFAQRREMAIQRVKATLNELDVDIAPVINLQPSVIRSELVYVDVQDAEMLARLDLMHLIKPKSPPPTPKAPNDRISN